MIQELEALAAKWEAFAKLDAESGLSGRSEARIKCASELRDILAKHKKPRDEREWCERNGKRPHCCMWWSSGYVAPQYKNDSNVLPSRIMAHMRWFRSDQGTAIYNSDEAAYADLRTGLIAAGEIEPPAPHWHCPGCGWSGNTTPAPEFCMSPSCGRKITTKTNKENEDAKIR